jgi:YHS domain-containing protein
MQYLGERPFFCSEENMELFSPRRVGERGKERSW